MKKVLFIAIAAVTMMAMVACNNNKPVEAEDTTTADTTVCENVCAMDSTCCADACMCGEECKAAKCEACPNHGTENCCKAKAAAEGKECCKKAEGKECEKKCEKAQ